MKNQPKQEDKTEDHSSQVQAKIHGMSHGFLNYLRPYYLGDASGPQKSRYVLWVEKKRALLPSTPTRSSKFLRAKARRKSRWRMGRPDG